jgi:integrase
MEGLMASLNWENATRGGKVVGKLFRVQFTIDDDRRTVRLGRVPEKSARTWLYRIESLVACKVGGIPFDADLAGWLRDLPEDAHVKLAAVGLVAERQAVEVVTLAMLTTRFVEAAVVKPITAKIYTQTIRSMHDYFGADTNIVNITAEQADGWRRWLSEPHSIVVSSRGTRKVKRLAVATQSKRLEVGRQILAKAARWGLIAGNPLEGIRGRGKVNTARQFYVTDDMIEAVLAACPDAGWRAIFALGRWGGLRIPSEVVGLAWDAVDWKEDALRVRSPKTEHHVGGESRLVPIVPRLRRVLEECFDIAPEGSTLIVPQFQDMRANLRTHSRRIIERAGLTVWAKPFQNMRSSRETDWLSRHPVASVAKWMGHSPVVSMRHYAQALPEHFRAAVAEGKEPGDSGRAKSDVRDEQIPTMQAPAADRSTSHVGSRNETIPEETEVFPGIVEVVNSGSVGATRFERATSTSRT